MRGLASAAVLLTACSTSFAVDAGERGDAAPHDAGRPDAGVVRILDASRPPPACVGLTIDAGPHHVPDSGFVCCCCGTVVWHFTDCAVGACDGFCP